MWDPASSRAATLETSSHLILGARRLAISFDRTEPEQPTPTRAGAWRLAAVVSGLAVVLVAAIGYMSAVKDLCRTAMMAPSLDVRRSAMREASRRIWFDWVPDPTGTVGYCRIVASDLAQLDAGLCPNNPIPGVPCRCGATRWPEDVACSKAFCFRGATFKCWQP